MKANRGLKKSFSVINNNQHIPRDLLVSSFNLFNVKNSKKLINNMKINNTDGELDKSNHVDNDWIIDLSNSKEYLKSINKKNVASSFNNSVIDSKLVGTSGSRVNDGFITNNYD